jgi:hypothetical protein
MGKGLIGWHSDHMSPVILATTPHNPSVVSPVFRVRISEDALGRLSYHADCTRGFDKVAGEVETLIGGSPS